LKDDLEILYYSVNPDIPTACIDRTINYIEKYVSMPRKCMYILLKNNITIRERIIMKMIQRLINYYGVKIRSDIFEHISDNNCRYIAKNFPNNIEEHNIKFFDSLITKNNSISYTPSIKELIIFTLKYVHDNNLIDIAKKCKGKKYEKLILGEINKRKLNY